MALPLRLRAWNLLYPGSKTARNHAIRKHIHELTPGSVLIAGHYPADFARIGDPTVAHDSVDVLLDGRRLGGVDGDHPVLISNWPQRPCGVVIRSLVKRVDLCVLELPASDGEGSLVLEFWPRRRWLFGVTSAGTFQAAIHEHGEQRTLQRGRLG